MPLYYSYMNIIHVFVLYCIISLILHRITYTHTNTNTKPYNIKKKKERKWKILTNNILFYFSMIKTIYVTNLLSFKWLRCCHHILVYACVYIVIQNIIKK